MEQLNRPESEYTWAFSLTHEFNDDRQLKFLVALMQHYRTRDDIELKYAVEVCTDEHYDLILDCFQSYIQAMGRLAWFCILKDQVDNIFDSPIVDEVLSNPEKTFYYRTFRDKKSKVIRNGKIYEVKN